MQTKSSADSGYIVILAFLLGGIFGFSAATLPFAMGKPDGTGVKRPSPPIVSPFDLLEVGGLLLVSPQMDSLGNHDYRTIPPNSILLVPKQTVGTDPKELTKS